MDVLSWGRHDFQISFSNRDKSRNAWNRHWGSFWSIWGSYQTIWSFPLTNVKWHSLTWPYTMTTPYWSDFVPNSTFHRILSGFHRIFATGVACRQGTLTSPDTWSRPFGICICSTFSELVVVLPDYALRISLGTFSILLLTEVWVFIGNSLKIKGAQDKAEKAQLNIIYSGDQLTITVYTYKPNTLAAAVMDSTGLVPRQNARNLPQVLTMNDTTPRYCSILIAVVKNMNCGIVWENEDECIP